MKTKKNITKKIGEGEICSTYELEQLKIKKLLFELMGISNYMMQDYENDSELTEFQQLWKALSETIDFLVELMPKIYDFKWNGLKYTDRELEILKAKKEIEKEIKGSKQ